MSRARTRMHRNRLDERTEWEPEEEPQAPPADPQKLEEVRSLIKRAVAAGASPDQIVAAAKRRIKQQGDDAELNLLTVLSDGAE